MVQAAQHVKVHQRGSDVSDTKPYVLSVLCSNQIASLKYIYTHTAVQPSYALLNAIPKYEHVQLAVTWIHVAASRVPEQDDIHREMSATGQGLAHCSR